VRLLFFGSSGFSVPALLALRPSISLVVTKKAKPKGRGYHLDDNEVKQAATSAGLPLAEIDSFRDEEAKKLAEPRPDLFVVVSFGLIIPGWFLDAAAIGAINVHPSLLPKYRGPSPMQWAIRNGDKETGLTIISMAERMDAGDVLYQERTPIGPDEDTAGLSRRLSLRAAEILPSIVERVTAGGMAGAVPQDEGQATYTAMVTKEMGRIEWTAPAEEVMRQIKAFVMWPTAYTFIDGKMLKVYKAKAPAGAYPRRAEPGTVVSVSPEGIEVAAGSGSVVIEEVQMENRKRMAASEFARGYRRLTGKRLAASPVQL
jgi:methionyl-tRNA formyltransferase